MKHLLFRYVNLNQDWWNALKKILPKIESLVIFQGDFNLANGFLSVNDLYKKLLETGMNLKELIIRLINVPTHIGNYAFMHQNYPNLQACGIYPMAPVDDLNAFFEQNPSVRSCDKTECSLEYIRENKDHLMNSTINLDVLSVVGKATDFTTDLQANTIDIFNVLYQRGFYKRLYLSIDDIPQSLNEQLNNLQGPQKLRLKAELRCILPHLASLKELKLPFGLELNPVDISKHFGTQSREY